MSDSNPASTTATPAAETPAAETPAETAVDTRAGKYLTFALADEGYGIEIMKVREIIGVMEITRVPRTPPHVVGVVNLRGQVISVVDLRSKFDMPTAEKSDETCIIVAETQRNGRKVSTGLIVDRVSEVLDIAEAQIDDAPQFAGEIDTGFIRGMGKVGDAEKGGEQEVKILLDIDAILDADTEADAAEETPLAA
ncbi:MAG: chemotaxis protein CheW [Planctomycetota bacterium]